MAKKTPAQTYYLIKSQSSTFIYPGVIENELAVKYNVNYSSYDNPVSKSTSQTINMGIIGKKYVKKLWVLNYDLMKQFNSGYMQGVKGPFIINMGIERTLFKNEAASLKLTAFDLLNQSVCLQRTVVSNQIIDAKTNS